jgi:iron complex outermembrane receptor protein
LEALAVDWANKRALVQLDLESFGIDITENASILQNKAVSNNILLPRIPNATTLLSGTWAHSVASGQNYGVRGVYAFSKAFSIVAEEGHSEAFRNQRFVPQIGTINLTTGLGTETVTLIRDQYDLNTTQDIELHLDDRAGNWLANHLVFGYSDSTRDFNNPTNGSASIKNVSIYAANPQVVVVQASGPLVFNPQNDNNWDYFVHDQLDLFGNRLHAIAGIRKINFFGDFQAPTTRNFNIDTQTVWAPGYGLVADITPNVSLYGDYVKSLQEGGQAPANSANAYQVLPPATAQQSEVGIREQSGLVSATFAYFSLELANALTNPTTNIYALNGTETFDGLESTVAYNVGGGLSLVGSGQYMHAFQTAADPTINGFRPENTPIVSGSVGLRYAPPGTRGTSVFADLLSTGPRMINPQNQGIISQVTLLNTGFQFLVRNHDSRYNVIVTCKNCMNKPYWSSAVNGALGIGQPRTVQLYVRALAGRGAGP